MELYTIRALSNLPQNTIFTQSQTHFRWKTSLPFKRSSVSRPNTGLRYYREEYFKSLRSKLLAETSTEGTKIVNEGADGSVHVVDIHSVEKNDYEKTESSKKDSSIDGEAKPFKFLDNLNLELDFEKDKYSILLYGGGSLLAFWLTAAVVGAVDSIPLFPKLLEIVGLAYAIWFTTRYLIYKRTRVELFAKIEEIKREVFGSDDA